MTDESIEILVWLYNIIALLIPVALLLAIWQLVAAIIGWRSEFRNRRLRRFVLLTASGLFIPVLLTGLWRGVIRPAKASKLLTSVNAQRAETLSSTSVVNIGDAPPVLHVLTIDGQTISIPSDGDVVLINFFATWCGPCLVELPFIERIWLENKQNPKFKLAAIGREESVETLLQFRDKHGLTFPICADSDSTIFSRFAKEAIPRTLIVAPDGRIVYSKVGFMDEDVPELTAVLKQQLKNAKN